jgi:hypothetical protein
LEYAFRLRNVQKVWLTVNSDNERALRSYERCGFVEEGRLRKQVWNNGRYIDLVYMGVLREEWEASFAGGQLLEQGGENRGMARESKHQQYLEIRKEVGASEEDGWAKATNSSGSAPVTGGKEKCQEAFTLYSTTQQATSTKTV